VLYLCRHDEPDRPTHSDDERCLVGTWVLDELRKAVQMGYALVEVFEFWEYDVTCLDNDTGSGGLLQRM
jgi:hypothetical protein